MIIASELRAGMAIRIEGQVYKVLDVKSKAGTAKLGGVVKTKLRNAGRGRMWEPRFRPDERLEAVPLEQQIMKFLFADGDFCTFRNSHNQRLWARAFAFNGWSSASALQTRSLTDGALAPEVLQFTCKKYLRG